MSDVIAYSTFIESKIKDFAADDIFETESPTKIKKHTHSDLESRFFLEGEGYFTIGKVVYHCNPGTYIEIPAGIEHSFEYKGPEKLKVLRFFSENPEWIADFCEGE